jgi:3-phenylpropionate/trans-cinnamate dioxygenase ferredoxin reductase subunit
MAPEFRPGARVLVVGGGYIGLESAAVAASRGLRVTLVEMAPRILQRVASAATSDYFRELHRAHGVDLREGAALRRLEGRDGRVVAAVLEDGEPLPVDFVIVGIGIAPDTRLADAAGLATDNGIAVDALCRTSDPAIFAAGDCTSFPWRDGRVRLESVQNAIDQGEHAAACMLGGTAPYRPSPWFWSDQYDCKLQIAGLHAGHDRTVTRPGARPGSQSVWYYAGDRLVAVDAMNDPRSYMTGKRWLEAGASPDPARIADPATDLRELA